MKKLIFIYLLIFTAIPGFAQKWKPTNLDDSVQVSLPSGFTKKDTLGQTLFNADSPFGQILITKQPDDPSTTPDIEKVDQLKRYYDNFLKRIQSTSKGVVSEERDTLIGKLKVKDFKLAIDSGSGKQYRNIRILHVNSATYTFQFLYKEIHESYAGAESNTFFNSIKIPPEASVSTQFTEPENTTGKKPAGGTNYVLIGIIAGVILLIVVIILVRKRKKRE
ncbi:MAG: hypothetical protein ACO1NU_00920 [Arcticibacter sp.]